MNTAGGAEMPGDWTPISRLSLTLGAIVAKVASAKRRSMAASDLRASVPTLECAA